MQFCDSFEIPVMAKLDDKDYPLPRLTTRDFRPWVAERKAAYQSRNLPLLESTYSGEELMQRKSAVLGRDFTPDDLQGVVSTDEGSERVIKMAFVKMLTGKRLAETNGDEDAKAAVATAEKFIETLSWPEQQLLALRVSGLFSEAFINDWLTGAGWKKPGKAKEQECPNAEAGNLPTTASLPA